MTLDQALEKIDEYESTVAHRLAAKYGLDCEDFYSMLDEWDRRWSAAPAAPLRKIRDHHARVAYDGLRAGLWLTHPLASRPE